MTLPANYQTILVAVTASSHSLEAIAFACSLAKARKSNVIAVHVIEVNRSMPLDANLDSEARKGEQILRKAEEIAAGLEYHITGELIQARVAGPAIVEEAADRGADLIVLGVSYDHHGGGSYLGAAADYVLRNAEATVLISRQSASRKEKRDAEKAAGGHHS